MNEKGIEIFVTPLAMVHMGFRVQSATSLEINEILVIDDQNYQDDYGLHNAWIEISNTSFIPVSLEDCFLTNDKNNPTKYPISKGNMLISIKSRQHALFWVDEMPNRGTFHADFTLDPDKENYIALYDSNGKALIDEVIIPAGQPADRSYAHEKDGSVNQVVKGGEEHSYVTPSANNMIIDKNPKVENLKRRNSIGIGMAIIVISIVFIGLVLPCLSFKAVDNVVVGLGKKNMMKTTGIADKTEAKEKGLGNCTGEETAAIAMASHEYLNDVRDVEDIILTINKVRRTYSPRNPKIYTPRRAPGK